MKKNGFTLIEILVVIAIIAILTLIAVPAVLKIYNKNVIKSMHIQETEIKDAANLFVEDYCKTSIDQTKICPKSYSTAVNNKKTVCLKDLQNKSDKYIDTVKYKGSDCKGYVTYYLDSETGVYGNEKTFLFCGLNEDGSYDYATSKDYDFKEYCSCSDDEICKEKTERVYCTFDGELKQGAEYVNGQYTYRYMQKGTEASSGLAWTNMGTAGWGVQLTDKTSSKPVTSKVCTYINNKPVISMSYMYSNSQAIDYDLSTLNTSKVTDMRRMFYKCKATTLDLSSFDTSKVTSMSGMFSGTQDISLDLSGFDTGNVTSMRSMFDSSQISSLDLQNFNTSKVTDMSAMFWNTKVNNLDLSNFNTNKVTNMSYMFARTNITELDFSNFDTSKVTTMREMFRDSKFEKLDLSNFNTGNVTDMSSMFVYNDSNLIDLTGFDTSKVTDMGSMFYDCNAIEIKGLENFNTSNLTRMGSMFGNSKAEVLDLSSFDISKVTDMSLIFWGSKAKVGYAKDQATADRFNDSDVTKISNSLKFTVK